MSLIEALSRLGRRWPLPATRLFVRILLGSIASFALVYAIIGGLAMNGGEDFARAPAALRYSLQFLAFVPVILVIFSGAAVMFRLVFHWNGANLLRMNREAGVPQARLDYLAAISRKEFSDGIVLVAWAIFLIGGPIALSAQMRAEAPARR